MFLRSYIKLNTLLGCIIFNTACIHSPMKSESEANCPKPLLEDFTMLPWDASDQAAWNEAPFGCQRQCGLHCCVKKFKKIAAQNYWVICKKLKSAGNNAE